MSEADRAAIAFFESAPILTKNAQALTLRTSDGVLRLIPIDD
jgi:hypothetical protein